MMIDNKVCVAGVGMIPFVKPVQNQTYDQMGAEACRLALADAGIAYEQLQQAYVGYVYGDSTCGQKALYHVGKTGIPVINVNNNCSTGSTALFLARQAIASGALDCVLALGFEQMSPGALGSLFNDRASPFEAFDAVVNELTVEDVMNDQVIWPDVLTRSMACAPTCGAAAVVLVSERFAKKHGLRSDVVIRAQAMTTDTPSSFEPRDMIQLVGFGLTQRASQQAYAQAGISAQDIDVCELHDCFAQNELLCYEALGFCGIGEAEQFVNNGDNTYGGQIVTNPSGGLLSKGHPLGATGLAQCYELTHQLRGTAGARQVEGARNALQHNLGLGGACVVTLYQKQ